MSDLPSALRATALPGHHPDYTPSQREIEYLLPTEILRGVYPEPDPSVASLPQDDKGEGLLQNDINEGLTFFDRLRMSEGIKGGDRRSGISEGYIAVSTQIW